MNVRKHRPTPNDNSLDWVQVDMSMLEACALAQFLIDKGYKHGVASELANRLCSTVHVE